MHLFTKAELFLRFNYYATKTANQKLNRKNRYSQTLTRRKNIVTIQIIYRITLNGLISHSVNYMAERIIYLN